MHSPASQRAPPRLPLGCLWCLPGGVWGPAAQAFFEEAAFYNHYNERDIDRYHWNTAKFKTLWRTKFAVLMARERGRIGSDAALGDMPKRLQAHSYDEMNEGPAR